VHHAHIGEMIDRAIQMRKKEEINRKESYLIDILPFLLIPRKGKLQVVMGTK